MRGNFILNPLEVSYCIGVDSRGGGEFDGSEKGQSLISADWSLAILLY